MLRNRHAEGFAHGEGLAHDLRIHHRQPVIGEADRAGFDQHCHFGQLLTLHAFRDGRIGADIDIAGFQRPLLQEGEDGDVVHHRLGVGHSGDGGDAACRSAHGAGFDGFLVFLPRFAEMHLNVEQAGAENVAMAVDDFRAVRRFAIREQAGAEIGDGAALGKQRAFGVKPRFRVDEAGVDVGNALTVVGAGGFGELGHLACPIKIAAIEAAVAFVEFLI